ncbi:MAG: PrsW family intramembrane metalloprotease [Archangiaceae bacterium]|nr:PrsW family intramembrane metalloprotease [Archangiaceae bacterium]
MNFIVALSGMLPALFLMWYVERHDAKRPEPRSLLRKTALFGGLSTIPCIIIQVLIDNSHGAPQTAQGALFTAYIVAGVTEETAKALCLYFAVWRHPAFDERFDGIVYGTRAGLGFALVENVGYLLGAHSMAGFIGTFIMRAVLAVPGHAIWGGFMGHYAAKKRFDRTGPGLLGGLAIAIFLHGTYDAALFLQGKVAWAPLLLPVPLIIIIGGYRRLRKHAMWAIAKDDLQHAVPAAVPRLPLGMGFVLR